MLRKLRRKVVRLVVVSGAGAAATYFFDRERGPERREQAKEKAASLVGRQPSVNDWQSSAANSFETPTATTAAPASAPVDLPQTPPASVSDILDGSGGDGDSVVEPAPGPGPVPKSEPTSTS